MDRQVTPEDLAPLASTTQESPTNTETKSDVPEPFLIQQEEFTVSFAGIGIRHPARGIAEDKVGDSAGSTGEENLADQGAAGVPDVDTVATAGVDVSFRVAFDAVRVSFLDVGEHTAVGEGHLGGEDIVLVSGKGLTVRGLASGGLWERETYMVEAREASVVPSPWM